MVLFVYLHRQSDFTEVKFFLPIYGTKVRVDHLCLLILPETEAESLKMCRMDDVDAPVRSRVRFSNRPYFKPTTIFLTVDSKGETVKSNNGN